MRVETITLGGGCFWCTEAIFDRVQGVVDVESGYCNGHVQNPSYEQVCRGDTGHVEVVKVQFNPQVIGLREILEIFFATHDPTTLNRQGNDVGPQYRSGIYVSDPAQALVAHAVIDALLREEAYPDPIVTEVLPLENYWPAEAYHQDYFLNNPYQGYCAYVVRPKVQKFLNHFGDRAKP